jgi:hypothetical protein
MHTSWLRAHPPRLDPPHPPTGIDVVIRFAISVGGECSPSWLSTRYKRPHRRAAEERDDLAPLQSIELHLQSLSKEAAYRIGLDQSGIRCAAGFRLGLGPDWVMNGPKTTSALSPFDSQLRTLVGAARRSHSCRFCCKKILRIRARKIDSRLGADAQL